jgi:hypothetical protein
MKYSDDAELIYVSDQAEWDNDAELHCTTYDESDCLIDSSGNIFALATIENNYVNPKPDGYSMTLHEILGLVKAHAAQKGSCCVAKLYAATIVEAFKIVESLDET